MTEMTVFTTQWTVNFLFRKLLYHPLLEHSTVCLSLPMISDIFQSIITLEIDTKIKVMEIEQPLDRYMKIYQNYISSTSRLEE